jgi:MFS family permease
MDHFEYLPMGKRRPWVIGAQFGMVASLLALMWVDDPASQIGLLTAIGFLINAFTATQDVAVDGMSIDLVPLEEEGRLNAFMSFGKAVGWAVTSAITGSLLVLYGMKVTALVSGIGAALIFILLIMIRERKGERLFPWTEGAASEKNEPPQSFKTVFFRSQSCFMGEGQPHRDGHHVFRWAGGRLWPRPDAHCCRASIQFHDASMGQPERHHGSGRRFPGAGPGAHDRPLRRKAHVVAHHIRGWPACLPAGGITTTVE